MNQNNSGGNNMIVDIFTGVASNFAYNKMDQIFKDIKKQKELTERINVFLGKQNFSDIPKDEEFDTEGLKDYLEKSFFSDYQKYCNATIDVAKDYRNNILTNSLNKAIITEKGKDRIKNLINNIIDICDNYINQDPTNRNHADNSVILNEINNLKSIVTQNQTNNTQQPIENKLTLFIEGDCHKMNLSAKSVDVLKHLYKNNLSFDSLDISFESVLHNPATVALPVEIKQRFLLNYKSRIQAFIYAVEFMIKDSLLSTVLETKGNRLEKYVADYGVNNLIYEDEIGLQNNYSLVYYWKDVIEELLKEFRIDILGRANKYIRDENLFPIDVSLHRPKNDVWDFISFLSKKDDYKELSTRLQLYGDYSIYDIPDEDVLNHIIPDFYWNLGWLKAGQTAINYDDIKNVKGLFDIYHYNIGLH